MSTTITQLAGTAQTLASANGSSTSNGAASAAGTDLDNTTELAVEYDFEIVTPASGQSSITAGTFVRLYLVPKLDGTNAAGSTSATPLFQPDHYAGTFTAAVTGTAAQRMTVQNVRAGPWKYTAYLVNNLGVTLAANWTLKAYPKKFQSA